MLRRRTPKYRHFKPKNLAMVVIDGHAHYLGKYDSPESRERYHRIVAEFHAGRNTKDGEASVSSNVDELTVNEMLLAYLGHVDRYYVKDGKPTVEPGNIRLSIRPLRRLHGHTIARGFGPLALKAVRNTMIDSGLCRSEINRRVGRLVRAFKWAASEELVPPGVHQALRTVTGLRRGRDGVRESKPVKPVPEACVEAILPHVSRQVRAMVELQLLTGMRPGEVVSMRAGDIDPSGRVWTYTPATHKTEHHGKSRQVYLGPRAQDILRPWLRLDSDLPLFSPAEAMEERLAARRLERKSKVQPSQRSRAKAHPKKLPGETYSVESYRRAVSYGCRRASVLGWHPHQLRHTAATRLRKEFGLEVARVVLGHSSAVVTEIYAEVDGTKAIEAMEKSG